MNPRSAYVVLFIVSAVVSAPGPRPAFAQAKTGIAEIMHRRSFDGMKGQAAVPAAAMPEAPPVGTPVAKRASRKPLTEQSGADLFYFTPEEAKLAAKRFKGRMTIESAGYTFDRDVPQEIQAQMRGDLAFIGGIQGRGASDLHQQIFGSVAGADYKAFFESRVKSIGMDDCGSSNAVACVIPYWNPSKMWLTKNFVNFSHPQIARLMIVFHEARHTETANGNWPHARCPSPFQDADGNQMRSIWTGASLARQPACDSTAFGSYGSSTIMLLNIQKYCESCTDKVRMDAGLYGEDQLGRIINSSAKKQIIDDIRG